MTGKGAATCLFVYRSFICRLLAAGELLEVLPRNPSGEPDINAASVHASRKDGRRDTGVAGFVGEDDESPGP